jgi:hypothetical protein
MEPDSTLITVIVVGVILVSLLVVARRVLPLIGNARMKREVLQTGTDAMATILSIHDTGVQINDQPMLRLRLQVQARGLSPFEAEVEQVVPYAQLSVHQPGARLAVKYDPRDHTRIAVVPGSVTAPATGGAQPPAGIPLHAGQVQQLLLRYDAENRQVAERGLPAPAKVLQYSPMGINLNGNNPVVNLLLEVHPTDTPAFTAQALGIAIAEAAVGKYQPGQMVTVRYRPDDLTRVAVQRSGT